MATKITRWQQGEAPLQSNLVDAMKSEGLVPYIEDDEPGHFYEAHIHPNDEVIVMVSGEITFGVGEEKWVLGPGDRLDLPANTSHWAETNSGGPIRMLAASKGDKYDPLRENHTEANKA